MADKKISDFTALTGAVSGDLFEVETAGGNSRKITLENLRASLFSGAKARKSAALTGQNLVASAAVTWNSEDWDTDSYHDSGSNTDRMTVPAAGRYAVRANVRLDNTTSADFIGIQVNRYNSSDVFQENLARMACEGGNTAEYINVSGSGTFASGDFARVLVNVESDTSVDINTTSYFEIWRLS